ncbi:hypothetical protein [Kribbella sp. NPDC051718]|uniref:hypothetical protein n=1 Tax=Kribbella sp. NPDC051718 TaxID=3155168 RepID=UPI003416DA4B
MKIARMLVAASVGALALAPVVPAHAANPPCGVPLGFISAGGDTGGQITYSTKPMSARPRVVQATGLYADGAVRLAGTAVNDFYGPKGSRVSQYVIQGDSMYLGKFDLGVDNTSPTVTKVGSGWAPYTAFETTRYFGGATPRTMQYALRNDGTLWRWTMKGTVWTNRQSAPGFAAVKAIALISQTATYETFLATTRGGALYTIHIPTTATLKPVVRKVRASTWQAFDFLAANGCGRQGTLLVAIDKDTQSAYLYAIGHATGATTPIQNLGKIPKTYADPVYYHWTGIPAAIPFGE